MRELLPRRSALAGDAQRAVVVGGPVDDAETAVRLGEGAAGGREGVALQGWDDAQAGCSGSSRVAGSLSIWLAELFPSALCAVSVS